MKIATLSTLLVLLGSSVCLAQTPDPAAPAAPRDKTAISKSCTDQANQRGLHGKKRKTFRAQCKKNGGNPS